MVKIIQRFEENHGRIICHKYNEEGYSLELKNIKFRNLTEDQLQMLKVSLDLLDKEPEVYDILQFLTREAVDLDNIREVLDVVLRG